MSSTELFDIVDDQNQLTGQVVSRAEAHRLGLRHRVVHVYVFRRRGRAIDVLVHLRSPLKDQWPSVWDPRFGGHVRSGQSPLETAMREMEEELGMDVGSSTLLAGPILRRDDPGGHHNELTAVFAYDGGDLDASNISFKDGEVREVKWMALDEITTAIQRLPEQWVWNEELLPVMERIRDWLNTL